MFSFDYNLTWDTNVHSFSPIPSLLYMVGIGGLYLFGANITFYIL